MIILDTNVISEPTKQRGNPAVHAWLDRQMTETLYITATSLSELLTGIELIQAGKRKDILAASVTALIDRLFGSRVLAFDQQAAGNYAKVVGRTRSNGYTISVTDAQIAAIAAIHGFTVATRDTAPFLAAGTPVLNPWIA
ncbi:MAG TPA: type II toxin-antitoxin system VapC family toxin [Acidisarcina sp.]